MTSERQARGWLLLALADIERLGVKSGTVCYHGTHADIHIEYQLHPDDANILEPEEQVGK